MDVSVHNTSHTSVERLENKAVAIKRLQWL